MYLDEDLSTESGSAITSSLTPSRTWMDAHATLKSRLHVRLDTRLRCSVENEVYSRSMPARLFGTTGAGGVRLFSYDCPSRNANSQFRKCIGSNMAIALNRRRLDRYSGLVREAFQTIFWNEYTVPRSLHYGMPNCQCGVRGVTHRSPAMVQPWAVLHCLALRMVEWSSEHKSPSQI